MCLLVVEFRPIFFILAKVVHRLNGVYLGNPRRDFFNIVHAHHLTVDPVS